MLVELELIPHPIPRLVALACAVSFAMISSAAASEVTIYRDTWGIPHIYGDTAEAAAYGHGYAQAEDRLQDLLAALLMGQGRAASVFGEEVLELDRVARIARHAEVARQRYADQGRRTRDVIESFVAGVRAYMREHPDDVPDWAIQPEPHHVVALYRAFAWAWPWGQARGDLKRAGSHVSDGRGSNQWVVGAERTAGGSSVALLDPHLRWQPQNRFYEAHVHGGELNFYGFSVIGTPVMALGHTDVFSMALTTGGPDCADVYEEKINPDDPLQYEYDGKWRTIEVEDVEIEVRTSDGIRIEKLRIERTHHGPIVERRGDRAYAVRTGYDQEIGIAEQWLRMIGARSLDEFVEAMSANQSLPQNILYADVADNIYYLRAGRVPRRPEGFRWDRPVPGWTSETEWLGIHPLKDLVQIRNPAAGFIQNCNVSPDVMMPDSPLTADRYPPVIFNSAMERLNSRGRHALALLGDRSALRLKDALRIATDTYAKESEHWLAALESAHDVHRDAYTDLLPAVRLLLKWNGRMDVDSRAAPLFRFWLRAAREDGSGVPLVRVYRGESLSVDEQVTLLTALRRAMNQLLESRGSIRVPWGDLHRIGRGERSWPVGGCRADGISTLRSVRYSGPDDQGVFHASGGQICPTVVVLDDRGVTSYSVTPFGQSDDPASPHYDDQARKLFSRGKLRPTWYSKSDLLRHLESSRTLTVPSLVPSP